ncbi:MAG TPA: hypothetical protein VFM31_02590 [Nitrososphaeraceae archaeon]|nr:hypothetical protein [Nitrososphaeraceae archaeon]
MKQCTKCLSFKEENYFHKNKNHIDGLEYWCRDCWTQYRKEYRDDNLEKARLSNNERRAFRISWFQELKSNIPCVDCGQIYEPYCMDYDHIPEKGMKVKSVSRMVMDNTPKEIILDEIKKCDLVCLLCHNRRTYKRFNDVLGEDRKYKPHQRRNIDIINDIKNKPCAICNQQYDMCNMQIDHINPSTKLYDVCDLKNYKVEILETELEKCQVLCALCHRRKSIIEQKDNKYNTERPKPTKRQELFYDPISNIKECGRCHQIKNGSEFRVNKKTKSGLDTYCKECFNEYRRFRRNSKKV